MEAGLPEPKDAIFGGQNRARKDNPVVAGYRAHPFALSSVRPVASPFRADAPLRRPMSIPNPTADAAIHARNVRLATIVRRRRRRNGRSPRPALMGPTLHLERLI